LALLIIKVTEAIEGLSKLEHNRTILYLYKQTEDHTTANYMTL